MAQRKPEYVNSTRIFAKLYKKGVGCQLERGRHSGQEWKTRMYGNFWELIHLTWVGHSGRNRRKVQKSDKCFEMFDR